jgi:hypothetical protein
MQFGLAKQHTGGKLLGDFNVALRLWTPFHPGHGIEGIGVAGRNSGVREHGKYLRT